MNFIKEFVLLFNEEGHPKLSPIREFNKMSDECSDLFDILMLLRDEYHMADSYVECEFVIGLNKQNKVLGIIQTGRGSTDSVNSPIREIFISILLMGAQKFIHLHNHPDSPIVPSVNDLILNSALIQTADILNLELIYDLIIGEDGAYDIISKVNLFDEEE